jgi:hypothetical protein
MGDCISKIYNYRVTIGSSYDPNNVVINGNNFGNPVGTNSNTLNVSDIVASSTAEVAFPLNYTLTISSLLVVKHSCIY